jgi:hypothetical protein
MRGKIAKENLFIYSLDVKNEEIGIRIEDSG